MARRRKPQLLAGSFLLLGFYMYSGEASTAQTAAGDDDELTLSLPSVDLSRADASDQVVEACSGVGMFSVAGLRESAAIVREAFDASELVFKVPASEKQRHTAKPGGFTRGYIPLGGESGNPALLECKEAFSYGYGGSLPVANINRLQGPNVWPRSLNPAAKLALDAFFNFSVSISEQVARGLAPALNLTSDIAELIDGGETISLMRLFRYLTVEDPSCVAGGPASGERTGSSPHSDWGFLTLVLSDGPGLQLKSPVSEGWLEVERSARLEPWIICGDYIEILTKGRFQSPLHRVVLPQLRVRSSFVFFYYPSYHANFASVARHRLATVTGENAEKTSHNTMLDLAIKNPGTLDLPFGEYILNKWAGVQTPSPKSEL